MTYDFDTSIERRGTDSQKWQKYAGRDVLPLWVADMDFRAAPEVIAALQERVEHGVFGYAQPTTATIEAVVGAMAARYGWRVDPAWLVWLPGLVVGLNVTARAFTQPGETVLARRRSTRRYDRPGRPGPPDRGLEGVQFAVGLRQGWISIMAEKAARGWGSCQLLLVLCTRYCVLGTVYTVPCTRYSCISLDGKNENAKQSHGGGAGDGGLPSRSNWDPAREVFDRGPGRSKPPGRP